MAGGSGAVASRATDARNRATRVFYGYRVLSRAYFHLPILWVWFVEDHRVRVWVAAILLATYSATLIFGAPIARRLQHYLPPARSMLVGEIVKAAGLLGLVLSGGNVPGVIAAQLVGGIGYSLAQGPDSVLLRSLYNDDETTEYSSHESRSMSLVFVSVLAAGVAGGFLYGWVPASPFIASICTSVLAVGAAMIMGRLAAASGMLDRASAAAPGPAAGAAAGNGDQPRRGRQAILTAGDWQWMLYYAMVRGLALAAFVALLPMVFFVDLKVHVSVFGVVLGSFSLFAYLSGRYGTRAVKGLPDPLIPLLSAVALAGAFSLFAAAHIFIVALAGMALLGTVNGVVRPLAMSRLQSIPKRSAAARGVAVATMERCYGALNAVAIVAGGVIADRGGVARALWTYAALSAAFGILWLAAMARHWMSAPTLDTPAATQAQAEKRSR